MRIEDITAGDPKKRLTWSATAARSDWRHCRGLRPAAEQLLSRMTLPPCSARTGDQHAVLLIPGVIAPKPSNPWVNLLLFVLTVFSVIFAGALYGYNGPDVQHT